MESQLNRVLTRLANQRDTYGGCDRETIYGGARIKGAKDKKPRKKRGSKKKADSSDIAEVMASFLDKSDVKKYKIVPKPLAKKSTKKQTKTTAKKTTRKKSIQRCVSEGAVAAKIQKEYMKQGVSMSESWKLAKAEVERLKTCGKGLLY